MATMIEVDNLGKKYRLGGQDKYYKTLRESLVRGLKRPFQRLAGTAPEEEEFWALRNVSFTVDEGEVVGIIGRNGAGKSTLLKLLSRITRPTEGSAKLYGRVGSLLEVGTGFHPELTGRENIYLSGNLLGMTRAEVKAKFDEIVDFSGVEKFLDTPVKHYSSGMYVRLGFAIAAHLEPEILLVDEVLAVGDAQFQKKCLGKMGEVAKSGRTVLFVSHDTTRILQLCPRTIFLQNGYTAAFGLSTIIIHNYLNRSELTSLHSYQQHSNYRLKKDICSESRVDGFAFKSISISDQNEVFTGGPLEIVLDYECTDRFLSPAFWINFKTLEGVEILRLSTMPISGFQLKDLFKKGRISLQIKKLPLVSGEYCVNIGFVRERVAWISRVEDAVILRVNSCDVYKSGFLLDQTRGLIAVEHGWKHEEL